MCLYTKITEPMVAFEPIRCLKVVRTDLFHDCYHPLFYGGDVLYVIGKKYNVGRVFDVLKIDKRRKFQKVELGFHSYTVDNPNVKLLFENMMESGISCAVVECEIPEGTRYFEGYSASCHSFGEKGFSTETSYCSERIKIVRQLSYKEIEEIGKKVSNSDSGMSTTD